MESRKLEIILHCAKGLSEVKLFGTMEPYAVVWITGDGKEPKPCKTDIATKGGHSLVWNCAMQFDAVPMDKDCTLFCEIQHNGKLFDQKIGQVQVPFADLLAGDASGMKRSYPVKTSAGETEGEIILSHKFSVSSGGSSSTTHGSTSSRKGEGGRLSKLKEVAMNLATQLGEVVLDVFEDGDED